MAIAFVSGRGCGVPFSLSFHSQGLRRVLRLSAAAAGVLSALASGSAQAAATDPTPAELQKQIEALKQELNLLTTALHQRKAVEYGTDGESLVSMNATNSSRTNTKLIALGKDANAVTDSIAIGLGASTVDAERTSGQSVALGNSAKAGAKGVAIGSNVNASGAREGTVAIGANVGTRALYSTVVGTDSKIMIDDTKGTWTGQEANIQDGLSSITGSKNTLTSNACKVYAGMVTSIAGSANTVVNSNGVTVQGFANKVANAYLDLDLTYDDVLAIARGDYSFAQTKPAGSVAVVGSANEVVSQLDAAVIGS